MIPMTEEDLANIRKLATVLDGTYGLQVPPQWTLELVAAVEMLEQRMTQIAQVKTAQCASCGHGREYHQFDLSCEYGHNRQKSDGCTCQLFKT